MQPFSRRSFLAAGAAGFGAAAFSGLSQTFGNENQVRRKSGTDIVELGKTGLKCSMLGIGTGMTGGAEARALGTDGLTRLVRYCLDRGINYIDTADMYRTHVFLQIALQGVPRDKYFLLSKTMAKSAEVASNDVDRFLRELGCRHLDTCLIHCMVDPEWTTKMAPVMDALSAAKQAGKVRSVGVSCHSLGALQAAADCDWVEMILVRINHNGTKMDGTPEEVVPLIEKLHARGVGVLGMKIYGEGAFKNYEDRYKALEYVIGLKTVDAFTIGYNKTEQIDETLDSIEKILA